MISDSDALSLDQPTAEAVVNYLKARCFPEAKAVRLARGFGIEISSGRLVIIDPDDWHSDAKTIVRRVIQNARKGDLDAVRFLMEHSDFKFPPFSMNGETEKKHPNHETEFHRLRYWRTVGGQLLPPSPLL